MLKYVLHQEIPGGHPCNWFVISENPAVIADKIVDPKNAKVVKLDVDPSWTADIIMQMTLDKIAEGAGVTPGGFE